MLAVGYTSLGLTSAIVGSRGQQHAQKPIGVVWPLEVQACDGFSPGSLGWAARAAGCACSAAPTRCRLHLHVGPTAAWTYPCQRPASAGPCPP